MSNPDTPEPGVTLEEMGRNMAQMAARLERLERADRLGHAEALAPELIVPAPIETTVDHEGPSPESESESEPEGGSSISRRGAFRVMGAAAAAGAGVALGATAFGAMPAAAAPVAYVKLDSPNGADATTSVTTTTGYGLQGSTSDATAAGIGGQDTSTGGGIGTQGLSTNGLGLVAQGGRAPLLLTPAPILTGPPTSDSGTHVIGEVYVDAFGAVYVCVNSGSPGTWQRITPAAPDYNNTGTGSIGLAGSVNLLSGPVRVFDSRVTGPANAADPDRGAGPLPANSGVILQISGITVGTVTIPQGAVGVIGNATVAFPSAGGWLTLYPASQSGPPLISNLNFQSGDVARANFCVVALDSEGALNAYVSEASADVIFDVTGFVFGEPVRAV